MARFNLMLCMPNPRMHGLNGYREVMDTVAWGLQELGHEASQSVNRHDPSAVNIVFGAQVMSIDLLRRLPRDTIVYNFEQWRGLAPAQVRPEVHYIAANLRVWEYNREQLSSWTGLGKFDARFVPVGYAPVLLRVPKVDCQDIEVLMYGLSGRGRAETFHRISSAGLTSVFVSGLYGEARDQLIARSKLVLNVNLYEHSRIFEIVRVSYLLANRKAVVAVTDNSTAVDPEFQSCLTFTKMDKLVPTCLALITDDSARKAQEDAAFETFSKRDIRPILEQALG